MATSGSFNTSSIGNFYCTVSWERTGTSAANNEHYIKYSVVAHNSPGNYRTVYAKYLTINNEVVYDVSGAASGKTYEDGDTMISDTITIASSNSSGDGSIAIAFSAGVGSYPGTNISGSDSWSLTRIPRTATSVQSLKSKTSSSITMNWSSDNTIDYIWYSKDNGSTWTGVNVTDGKSGSYTISSLSANTTYKIKTRVRRKDTQLTTDSSALSVTTYAKTTPTISLSSKTSSSITVTSGCNVTVSNTRYRIKTSSGSYGSWQTSGAFSGLSANTAYTVQVEKTGKDSGETGTATLNVTTYAKTTPTISLSSKTSTSITVTSGCNVTVSSTQYRIKTSSGSYGSYQTSATFSGLTPNTDYVVEVKKVGKDSGESGTKTLSVKTYQQTIPTIEFIAATIRTITVDSGCNVEVSSTLYRIKKASETTYSSWQSSNVFSNLAYNTAYDVQVQKTGTESGESATATLANVYTLDVARITEYNPNWNVEESITFNMTNIGGCVMRLYLLYNNVEIIYRNNIEIVNGQYTFELTTEEKNQLYSLAAGETNPDFKFVVRSYYEGVLIGSDSEKVILIEFPTKAWVIVDGIWKRALVWGRPTIEVPWRQCLPWVDVNKNKDWKRV